MFLFSRSHSLLGIDIGTAYIKAVQIKKSDSNLILESYGLVNVVYPSEASVGFDVLQQTADVLKTLYEKAKFNTKQVVVSIPSNSAFVSILDLPPMTEDELQKSIEYQAKKYIPIPLADVNLGWQVLDDTKSLKSPEQHTEIKVKVLLTAVPKNVINNYTKVFELAGLEPQALEIESLSLIRSLIPADEQEGILIVDIGAKSTILSLVQQRYLWATRHVSVGGDTMTESIAHSMGVATERAEEMKRSAFESAAESPALGVIRSTLAVIIAETQQMKLLAENQGRKISKIILTGGSSQLAGLEEEYIKLGLAVERGDPLTRLSFNPQLEANLRRIGPQLSVAVGLAMWSAKG